MSEHLRTVTSTQSVRVVPETRIERRQIRRAGISLPVRIRTADFNDGNFDEVRVTENASRKAIYFFTELNRYYKGMRVRVTSPYDANAGAANLEQIGEVARVHRRADGYGVAVMILAGAQPTPTQSAGPSADVASVSPQVTGVASTAPAERRCATRSPFIAPVEMFEMRTGSRIQARTSDLSPQGCYVDTLNPLPVGAAVRLSIHRGDAVLDVLANVSSRHVGSGMGLEFQDPTEPQRAIIQSWLGELSLPPRAVFDNSPFPTKNPTSSLTGDCATRIVQVLLRKGVLSQSEAREILQDYRG